MKLFKICSNAFSLRLNDIYNIQCCESQYSQKTEITWHFCCLFCSRNNEMHETRLREYWGFKQELKEIGKSHYSESDFVK